MGMNDGRWRVRFNNETDSVTIAVLAPLHEMRVVTFPFPAAMGIAARLALPRRASVVEDPDRPASWGTP